MMNMVDSLIMSKLLMLMFLTRMGIRGLRRISLSLIGSGFVCQPLWSLLGSRKERPVIAYSSKTWKLSSGEPMHSESEFWRPKLDETIEVVIALSTGLIDVQMYLEKD